MTSLSVSVPDAIPPKTPFLGPWARARPLASGKAPHWWLTNITNLLQTHLAFKTLPDSSGLSWHPEGPSGLTGRVLPPQGKAPCVLDPLPSCLHRLSPLPSLNSPSFLPPLSWPTHVFSLSLLQILSWPRPSHWAQGLDLLPSLLSQTPQKRKLVFATFHLPDTAPWLQNYPLNCQMQLALFVLHLAQHCSALLLETLPWILSS